jgi:glycosyltransferase involved in cell wall biosynthesis
MKIAILHYHLNRGGVTRVIQNQLLALDAVLKRSQTLPVALVHGGRQMGWPEDFPERLQSVRLTFHTVGALDYDEEQPDGAGESGTLGEQLVGLLSDLDFSPEQTVVHVHNHAVGKNVSLPQAICSLAERGYPLLLHIHDFVEDFRPANFRHLSDGVSGGAPTPSWHGGLYPQSPQLHYAVLNGRDRRILEAAGTQRRRLHLLPNPVLELDGLPPSTEARDRLAEEFAVNPDDPFILYPVRGIRRKNVGEALLYGKLAPPGSVVGLTLAPLNPGEQAIYARWKQVADELELPCRFDIGAEGGLTFRENLAASDLILTTSVAEGFGMAYLESWLAGRVLVGRDLPEITTDFRRAGVRLDSVQPRLQIPVRWVGGSLLRQAIREAYRATLAAYERPHPPSLSDALDAKTARGLADFGDLNEPLQERVLERVCRSDRDRRELLQLNPRIEPAFSPSDGEHVAALVRQNVGAIHRHFSTERSGRRLLKAYRQVADSPRDKGAKPLEHADRILDSFLRLERFRLILGHPE